MKAVVLAYQNIGCAALQALLDNDVEVAAVFTHRDDPGENVWFRSVADLASEHGIPVYAPDDVNHPLWVEKIRSLEPDCIFSFFYRKMLKAPILSIPKMGAYNLHASLLPKYRGRCPINWVLVNGETETGLTLHHMTERPDDGDIVGQAEIAISAADTARTLNERLSAAVGSFLKLQIEALASGNAPRIQQDESKATYFGGRRPADGQIDWARPAATIRNLIRAVTNPYPGAFTHSGGRKLLVWAATAEDGEPGALPGTVIDIDPLTVACGEGKLRIDRAQDEKGVAVSGRQLASDLNLRPGMKFRPPVIESRDKKRVLILGVNGFIGNALSERLLADGSYEVHGLDKRCDGVARFLSHPDFHFTEGDISIHREWLRYHVSKSDVVLPLVAIATPIEYVRNPLRVFELDFEENLRVIRYCVEYGKRVVFPSTSEVYGLCDDPEFDEDKSRLILGPIRNQRWIYSCSKQLLDRVIWAYGAQRDLRFTLFRPFNWIGPRLDSLDSARIGSSRAITQMILNLVEGSPILLIDGGSQKRCFTAVEDGIEGLFRVIQNKGGRCDKAIINLGNPDGELSIRELAEQLVDAFNRHPLRDRFPPFAGLCEVESSAYYGKGYEDVQHRKPAIANARRLLDWKPTIDPRIAVERTLDFFLRNHLGEWQ